MAAQDNPTPRESIEAQINDRLFGTRTAMLCRVVSYVDVPRPLVTVQVAANKWRREGERIVYTPESQLQDVPVMELAWGTFVVRGTLEPGDHGVLLVADRDIDDWILQSGGNTKGQYDPGIALIHDINDALFLPMIQPNSAAGTPKVGVRQLVISDRAGTVSIRLDDVKKSIDVEATTKVTLKALGVDLDTPGVLLGPYTAFGINAASIGNFIGTTPSGPVVWAPNPAAGLQGVNIT